MKKETVTVSNNGEILTLNVLRAMGVSCANRDEAGTPKTVNLGGTQRARWSSQSVKRAMRTACRENPELSKYFRGLRTMQIEEEVAKRLINNGMSEADAITYSQDMGEVLRGGKTHKDKPKKDKTIDVTKVDSKDKSLANEFVEEVELDKKPALMFLSESELDTLALSIIENKKNGEKLTKNNIIKLLGGKLPEDGFDIRLFGRMVATLNELSVDGCSCMAHPISTHGQSPEIDFFTAMDDLISGKQGAAYMDNTEFNAPVMYECFVLDIRALFSGYGHFSAEDRKCIITIIIRAFLGAIPTGRRHTMFSDTPVSYVSALQWKTTPLTLVNAFHKSVVNNGSGLISASIDALKDYWTKLQRSYGEECSVKQVGEFVFGQDSIGEFTNEVANEFIK